MPKIVECVPNISEGRNEKIINACADAVRKVQGATLLDIDPGKSTNRTVFTFVGDPDSVVEAAFQFAKTAYQLIDMTKHSGEHPRLGAVDVVPFVPVSGVTTQDCVECAKKFGKKVGEKLGIPIYLYEEASVKSYRKALKQIREGEYEGLKEKIYKPEWKPDFGPQQFIPKSGATVTGARFFLIAYNVNILGTKEQAHRIALNIREQGRGPDRPGRLKAIKAIGWYVDEYNMAQVSINIDNYKITPPHVVFEECVKDAKKIKVAVCGSELVGLIPLEAMLMAANYYIKEEDLFILDERQKIRVAIDRLGLNSISQFIPERRIIEYMIDNLSNLSDSSDSSDLLDLKSEKSEGNLASMKLKEFIELVGSRSSAPGGGSVSAVAASLGAALGTMMGLLSYGSKKFEKIEPQMRKYIPPLHDAMQKLVPLIDEDTNAFTDYMLALKLPKNTEQEKKLRNEKIQEGLKKAVNVPLSVMRIADSCWKSMLELAKLGNISSSSDLAVGAKCLEAGIWGAYKNVEINIPQIEDKKFKKLIIKEANQILKRAEVNLKKIITTLKKRKS